MQRSEGTPQLYLAVLIADPWQNVVVQSEINLIWGCSSWQLIVTVYLTTSHGFCGLPCVCLYMLMNLFMPPLGKCSVSLILRKQTQGLFFLIFNPPLCCSLSFARHSCEEMTKAEVVSEKESSCSDLKKVLRA